MLVTFPEATRNVAYLATLTAGSEECEHLCAALLCEQRNEAPLIERHALAS